MDCGGCWGGIVCGGLVGWDGRGWFEGGGLLPTVFSVCGNESVRCAWLWRVGRGERGGREGRGERVRVFL